MQRWKIDDKVRIKTSYGHSREGETGVITSHVHIDYYRIRLSDGTFCDAHWSVLEKSPDRRTE